MGKKVEFTSDKNTGVAPFLASAVAGLSRAAADKLVEHRRLRLGVYPTRRRGVQSADNAVEFRNDAFPDIKRMYRVADERKSDRSKSVRT